MRRSSPPLAAQPGAAPRTLSGVLAALLAVAIWAGWIVSTRHVARLEASMIEIGLLRYGVSSIPLLPWLLRGGLWPRLKKPWLAPLIVAGAGAPFFLIGATGMRFAPTAHISALQPGAMPLFVSLLAWLVLRERFGPFRLGGLALITAGILAIGGGQALLGAGPASLGHGLFLTAAAFWSVYTLAFRFSGLAPLQASALISGWSCLIHGALAAGFGDGSLLRLPVGVLVWQGVIQGLGSGFLASVAFGYAVRWLGASQAGAFVALVPVAASLGGALFLGEQPSALEWGGVLCVSCGVFLASGLGEYLAARQGARHARRRRA